MPNNRNRVRLSEYRKNYENAKRLYKRSMNPLSALKDHRARILQSMLFWNQRIMEAK